MAFALSLSWIVLFSFLRIDISFIHFQYRFHLQVEGSLTIFTVLLNCARTHLFDAAKSHHLLISFLLCNFYTSIKLCVFTNFFVEGKFNELSFYVFFSLPSVVQSNCSINVCWKEQTKRWVKTMTFIHCVVQWCFLWVIPDVNSGDKF